MTREDQRGFLVLNSLFAPFFAAFLYVFVKRKTYLKRNAGNERMRIRTI